MDASSFKNVLKCCEFTYVNKHNLMILHNIVSQMCNDIVVSCSIIFNPVRCLRYIVQSSNIYSTLSIILRNINYYAILLIVLCPLNSIQCNAYSTRLIAYVKYKYTYYYFRLYSVHVRANMSTILFCFFLVAFSHYCRP